ncbi:hypothetical protein TWF225_008710 [Orbilia oligospora]|uniref:Uncharacterized protein n=1 Tax=Orbilia oligospora TaxID=2813651 RepID=A0A7C8PPV7_ORBOL|nr:hypothetical protein TWF751_007878 [Orbilia oligospora]KAF3176248.1 hypothetical protein TWF225_008710 [Orbilia oligospora]KAF3237572.1 hypothetical protein TWF128_000852 [Orbilia oligospora]KAF3241169.1 hypothetical protein TWF217_000593 [Orbilia oligospora]KAF3291796.1 hypothetical protein TWF132_006539 [Orbilia oligospora]
MLFQGTKLVEEQEGYIRIKPFFLIFDIYFPWYTGMPIEKIKGDLSIPTIASTSSSMLCHCGRTNTHHETPEEYYIWNRLARR